MKKWIFALVLIITICLPPAPVRAETPTPTPYPPVTPQDLINLINNLRKAKGRAALIVDPILMGTAQETADTMALGQMGGHIGGVKERVMAAGYGAGDIPWATENYAVGPASLEQIAAIWADDVHMIPVSNSYYEHIGAGVAEYDGTVYYVIHAAYCSNRQYKPAPTVGPGTPQPTLNAFSNVIYPVRTSTPRPDGRIVHEIKQGQSLWSIAIAYGTKINAIIAANSLSPDNPVVYTGQKLYIPVTAVPPTPTPVFTETLPFPSPSATALLAAETAAPAGFVEVPQPTPADPAQTALPAEGAIITGLAAAFGIGLAFVAWGMWLKGQKTGASSSFKK